MIEDTTLTPAQRNAARLLQREWAPIPVPDREKAPRLPEWQKLRVTEADLPRYFNGQAQNVGVLLGEPSGGRVDVDLDAAAAVALAPALLPSTPCVFGRAGKRTSHYEYLATPIPATLRFQDPDGTSLVELRSTGCQTIFPGSTHPSGEAIEWEQDGEPAPIDGADLLLAVQRLAAAALLARHWPAPGGRHEAAKALAGGLLRGGWDALAVEAFLLQVALAAGDEEARARPENVHTTVRRLEGDSTATGWPKLAELMGGAVVERARDWLGIRLLSKPALRDAPWPAPLAAEAYHGLAGAFVRVVEPHTESDSAALLIQFLVFYGNVIGRGPHFAVEADCHYTNEFVAVVGPSSHGRKGTATGHVRRPFARVDEEWADTRILSGLSSGEGFAYAVRDRVEKGGKVVDEGVADKRALFQEAELASILKVMTRDGNILSPQLRDAWDGRPLGTLTKNNPVRATNAHVSIVGHITADELRRYLEATEAANGFANRFLWVCARRSKLLPEGGSLEPAALNGVVEQLQAAITYARGVGVMHRDEEARAMWREVYPQLTADRPGLFGAVTGRAEAHVVRLANLYALLDQSAAVQAVHILAALAVWEYTEASARYIFGDRTGDPVADTILAALREQGPLDRTAISCLFQRNQPASRIARALALLQSYALAHMEQAGATGGKACEVWRAT